MRLRRMMSLFLAVAMAFGLVVSAGMTVSAESALVMSDEGIAMIKSFEGFAEKPYWDVNQYTVGYGTYCPDSKYEEYKENGITEEEADALLREHIAKYETAINTFADKYGRELTQYQFDALVCFSYNLGTGWIYSSSGNFRRVMTDPNASEAEILYWFAAHCSAGGTVLAGLVRRRAAEANLYLNGVYGTSRPDNYKYIKYNANGGTLTSKVNMYDLNSADRIQQTPTYEGYTFDGWYTELEGGKQVTVLDESTHGATLYAHWTPNEGTVVPEEDTNTEQEVSLTVTVTSNEVNLREGPGTNYTTIGTAVKGDVYNITKLTENGSRTWGCYGDGWICLDYTSYKNPIVEEETETPDQTGTLTGTVKVNTYLSIRSGAGTGYEVVGQLYNGDAVEILEQKVVGAATWGRIEQGWISLKYVVLDEEDDQQTSGEETPETEETPEEETPEEEQTPEEEPAQRTGVITAGSLLIRSGPGTSYDVAGSYKKGAAVTVFNQTTVGKTTWGRTAKGWISMAYVKLDPIADSDSDSSADSDSNSSAAGVTGKVTATSLRVRSGPGSSYSITGYVRKGAVLTVTETKVVGSTTWGKTEKGWVSLEYVKLDGELESVADVRTVTTSCLKVRKSAGTDASVVDYLYKGDQVTILETKTVKGVQWGRIATGWISLSYVK